MDKEPDGLQSMGSQRVGHDWLTNSLFQEEFPKIQWGLVWAIYDIASFYRCENRLNVLHSLWRVTDDAEKGQSHM